MDWNKARRSDNVAEDSGGGGGGFGRGGGGGRIGLGGLAVVVVVSLLLGKNPLEILGLLSGGDNGGVAPSSQTTPVADTKQTDFARAILGSTEDAWGAIFQRAGRQYTPPRMVLFHGGVRSACGEASSAMGPFYCPGDNQVYLDLDFFQEMDTRFHATGDFARAYVIAHEVGHHVQNSLGIFAAAEKARLRGAPEEGANGLSVRQELQADCFAGVWANTAQQQLKWLEPGDVEAALNAASAVGDDNLQKQARGRVSPDSFTHGSSAQRVRWFRTGFDSGDLGSCDTFKAANL